MSVNKLLGEKLVIFILWKMAPFILQGHDIPPKLRAQATHCEKRKSRKKLGRVSVQNLSSGQLHNVHLILRELPKLSLKLRWKCFDPHCGMFSSVTQPLSRCSEGGLLSKHIAQQIGKEENHQSFCCYAPLWQPSVERKKMEKGSKTGGEKRKSKEEKRRGKGQRTAWNL